MHQNYYQLAERLHRRYGRSMNEESAQDYLETLKKFTLPVASAAISRLRKSCATLPTPDKVEESCREAKNFQERDLLPLPSDMHCRYESQSESSLSRDLCTQVTIDDVKCCAAAGWVTMCSWHQLCTQAKLFPKSFSMVVAKKALADSREMKSWSQGEVEGFCKMLGFDPLRKSRPGYEPDMASESTGRCQILREIEN